MSKDFWNHKWENNQTGWDLGQVSPPLKAYFDQLKDKYVKILIPGAGNAYEAEYLHLNGFTQVYVIDISQHAIDSFIKRYPDFPKEHLICQDFFELNQTFDLVIEQTFFCAINPSLRVKYVLKMKEIIKPNGKLVGLMFNRDFNGGPPYGGCEAEYVELFNQHFKIITMKEAHNSVSPRQGNELFVIFKNEP